MDIKTKEKKKNIRYLKRVYRFKRHFLPLIILFERMGITLLLAPLLNRLLSLLKISKNVYTYSNYQRFGKSFNKAFLATKNRSNQVLFPMMFGNNSNFNLLILLLAKHLQTKGLHPVFLVCNNTFSICGRERVGKNRQGTSFFCYECYGGYKRLRNYAGIDLRFMKDYLSEDVIEMYNREGKNIDNLKNLDECMDYRLENGFCIGKSTKKRILRYFYCAELKYSREELTIYKQFLKEGIKYYMLLETFLKKNPCINNIVLHNGTLAFGNYLFDISTHLNINLVTYETYLGNNSFIYKRNDEVMKLNWNDEMNKYYSLNSFTNENKILVDDFFKGLQKGKDMYARLNEDHYPGLSDKMGDYICLFTNLNFDTSVLDRNTIFSSMEQWIYEVINFWEESVSEKTLIIRVHPAELKLKTPSSDFIGDRIRARIKKSNILLFDSNDHVNSYQLIEGMKFGLVYASTIGLEAMFAGKPVIVAGDPFYRNQPFTLAPSSKEIYFQLLLDYISGKENRFAEIEALYSYVYYIYFVRLKKLSGFYIQFRGNIERNDIPDYAELLKMNYSILDEFYNECFK